MFATPIVGWAADPRATTALRFTQRLVDTGVAPSTDSTGNSYDNALADNLRSTLKIELVYWPRTTFGTRAEAEHALVRYIGWYNPPPGPGRTRWTRTR